MALGFRAFITDRWVFYSARILCLKSLFIIFRALKLRNHVFNRSENIWTHFRHCTLKWVNVFVFCFSKNRISKCTKWLTGIHANNINATLMNYYKGCTFKETLSLNIIENKEKRMRAITFLLPRIFGTSRTLDDLGCWGNTPLSWIGSGNNVVKFFLGFFVFS